MEVTPGKTSLFGSLSRPKGKSSGKSKGPVRPPPGFVSYQIPNGFVPPAAPPSDNIVYESRCYNSISSRNGRGKGDPPTAGVHPHHLHNGGRAYSGLVPLRPSPREQEEDRRTGELEDLDQHSSPVCDPSPGDYQPPPWAAREGAEPLDGTPLSTPPVRTPSRCPGEGGKIYPRSPAVTPHLWNKDNEVNGSPYNDEESVRTLSSSSPDYAVNGSKPPLPGGIPKPPPRSRPRSWTSNLFNAIRNSGMKKDFSTMTLQPGMQRDPSTLTLASMRTGELGRSGRQKSVRFLANPSRIEPAQKFYSLPRFIQQPMAEKAATMSESVKAKARSRTPSPFSRFVKSLLIKGKQSLCIILMFTKSCEKQEVGDRCDMIW